MSLRPLSPCHKELLAISMRSGNLFCIECETEFKVIQIKKGFEKISARYNTNCIICGEHIFKNEIIFWKKQAGARYQKCKLQTSDKSVGYWF